MENLGRNWYKFSRNPMSIVGLFTVSLVVFLAVFAPLVAPYPKHAGKFVDFANASLSPCWRYPFGTDVIGRDIMSRIFFGFRFSLTMGVVVLAVVVPIGVPLGLIAGYKQGTWLNTVVMRITDIFLAVPPLVLALAICSVLTPGLQNAMKAVCLMWWPWYTRLVYGLASTLRNEFYVNSAEAIGANWVHIVFKELLPNCLSPIFTKMSLDMAWVILLGAALSFVGLGVQAPKPGLGPMVADGAIYLPDQWWISVFPALAIVLIVLGFNLLGDGLRDMFAAEEV